MNPIDLLRIIALSIFGRFQWSSLRALIGLPRPILSRVLSIRKGDLVIDCGANVGVFTLAFAALGARVLAFEPDPLAYSVLAGRCSGRATVECFPSAVGIQEGMMALHLHRDRETDPLAFSQGSSLLEDKPNVSGESVLVPVVDFAEVIADLAPVRFVKMDIEGFETVLIPHLLKRSALDDVEAIFVETHEKKWPQIAPQTLGLLSQVNEFGLGDKFYFNWP